MHRDPSLRTRNALVIPGVLLVLVSLVGILYAQAVRGDDVECGDGTQIVLAGACRSATLVLIIPLAIGILLLGLGAAKRSKVTCRLGHGTTATTMLAVLIALVALPLLAAGAILMMETADNPYVVTYQEIEFSMGDILAAVGLLMLLPLVPYLALYLATMRPPRCCRERSCFEPCFCDEGEPEPATLPPPPQIEAVPALPVGDAPMAPNETAVVTSSPWTGSTHVQPLAAPVTPAPRPARTVTWTPPPEPAPAPPEPLPAAPVMPTVSEEPLVEEPMAEAAPEPKAKTTRKAAPKTRKVTRKSKSSK